VVTPGTAFAAGRKCGTTMDVIQSPHGQVLELASDKRLTEGNIVKLIIAVQHIMAGTEYYDSIVM